MSKCDTDANAQAVWKWLRCTVWAACGDMTLPANIDYVLIIWLQVDIVSIGFVFEIQDKRLWLII